mgnify:CR=1 FL=1
MSAVGILCEYNPFHRGHQYVMDQARKKSGADGIVLVMSGDWVQRGEPAFFSKYERAQTALDQGADLIVELPARFCVSSAKDYAYGGMLALQSMPFVTSIAFGLECGDLSKIQEIAAKKERLDLEFDSTIQHLLKQGMTYPKAFATAYEKRYATGFVPGSNDILGIEYCCNLKDFPGEIFGIPRNNEFLSASELRQKRRGEPHLELEDFRDEIFWGILRGDLAGAKDVTAEILRRFQFFARKETTVTGLLTQVKHKGVSMARLKRCLVQMLLGIQDFDLEKEGISYLRVLGVSDRGKEWLGTKELFLTRIARDLEKLSPEERKLWEQDLSATNVYQTKWRLKYGETMPDEFVRPLLTRE